MSIKKQTALNAFIAELAAAEGKKSQVTVGNIREVLRLANKQLGGIIYKAIELKAGQ